MTWSHFISIDERCKRWREWSQQVSTPTIVLFLRLCYFVQHRSCPIVRTTERSHLLVLAWRYVRWWWTDGGKEKKKGVQRERELGQASRHPAKQETKQSPASEPGQVRRASKQCMHNKNSKHLPSLSFSLFFLCPALLFAYFHAIFACLLGSITQVGHPLHRNHIASFFPSFFFLPCHLSLSFPLFLVPALFFCGRDLLLFRVQWVYLVGVGWLVVTH